MASGEGRHLLHGDALLFAHLSAIGRMTAGETGPGRARARLEAELGAEAARRLVNSLSDRLRSTRPQTPLAFP